MVQLKIQKPKEALEVCLANEPAPPEEVEAVNKQRDLMEACIKKNTEKIQELLAEGVSPNVPLSGRSTAFHIACAKAIPDDVLSAMLRGGGAVNAQNRLNLTPLHCAAMNGHEGTVKFLLANGADKDLTTEIGETPAQFAEKNGHAGVQALLS